ncbi:hypothetical protein ACFLTX_04060 [Chloroflexota bacterium]
MVDQQVPEDVVLGIATKSSYYQEYCFFGEFFNRELVPVWPAERVENTTWLVGEKMVEYLLVETSEGYPAALSPSFNEISQSGDWILYHWEGE